MIETTWSSADPKAVMPSGAAASLMCAGWTSPINPIEERKQENDE
jgi:hypothetical protein